MFGKYLERYDDDDDDGDDDDGISLPNLVVRTVLRSSSLSSIYPSNFRKSLPHFRMRGLLCSQIFLNGSQAVSGCPLRPQVCTDWYLQVKPLKVEFPTDPMLKLTVDMLSVRWHVCVFWVTHMWLFPSKCCHSSSEL